MLGQFHFLKVKMKVLQLFEEACTYSLPTSYPFFANFAPIQFSDMKDFATLSWIHVNVVMNSSSFTKFCLFYLTIFFLMTGP